MDGPSDIIIMSIYRTITLVTASRRKLHPARRPGSPLAQCGRTYLYKSSACVSSSASLGTGSACVSQLVRPQIHLGCALRWLVGG